MAAARAHACTGTADQTQPHLPRAVFSRSMPEWGKNTGRQCWLQLFHCRWLEDYLLLGLRLEDFLTLGYLRHRGPVYVANAFVFCFHWAYR